MYKLYVIFLSSTVNSNVGDQFYPILVCLRKMGVAPIYDDKNMCFVVVRMGPILFFMLFEYNSTRETNLTFNLKKSTMYYLHLFVYYLLLYIIYLFIICIIITIICNTLCIRPSF